MLSKLLILLAFVLILAAGTQSVAGSHVHVGNQGQVFRLPWIEGGNYYASRGPNNCVSGYCHGPGAVDFILGNATVKAVGDGIVTRRQTDPCFGNVAEVKHNVSGGGYDYRSQYAHLVQLPPFSIDYPVQQGMVVGAMDTTGSCIIGGAHLHFDTCPVAATCYSGNSVAWPAQISQTSPSMWSTATHYAVSNNAGAGMWGAGAVYQAYDFRDAYLNAGGFQWRGSTSKMESSWDVCGASGPYRTISGCPSQFGDLHTQTFRGVTGNWRSAMVSQDRVVDGPVFWVARAFYAAYTNLYTPSLEWSYRLGAPTGNDYQLVPGNPNLLQQNFEGGYMQWNVSGCSIQGNTTGGSWLFTYSGSIYCDNGGSAAYPGYGADGD